MGGVFSSNKTPELSCPPVQSCPTPNVLGFNYNINTPRDSSNLKALNTVTQELQKIMCSTNGKEFYKFIREQPSPKENIT